MGNKKAVALAVFNQKGGVGKTSTAVNLMAALTRRKFKVLGIDIDAQGHLTKFLGVNTDDENTVMELLDKKATFSETVKSTRLGDVIPCDRNLQVFLTKFASDISNVFILQELVEQVGEQYDFIIIDCPPNVNQITTSALVAVNFVIVPTEAEYFSLDGVSEIAATLEQVKKPRLNPGLNVLGVLIVKYQPRRSLTKQIERHMEQLAVEKLNCHLFATRINYAVDMPASQAMKQSVFEYDDKSKLSKSFDAFADEVLEGVRKNG